MPDKIKLCQAKQANLLFSASLGLGWGGGAEVGQSYPCKCKSFYEVGGGNKNDLILVCCVSSFQVKCKFNTGDADSLRIIDR